MISDKKIHVFGVKHYLIHAPMTKNLLCLKSVIFKSFFCSFLFLGESANEVSTTTNYAVNFLVLGKSQGSAYLACNEET